MAYVVVVSAALLAWIAVYALTSDEEAGVRLAHRLALLVPMRIKTLVAWLSGTRVVRALLGHDALVHVCDALVTKMPQAAGAVVREEVCAALLLADVAASLACSFAARSLVAVPVVVSGSAVWCVLWDSARARRAEQELMQAMPGVFRTLAMAMGSGETLSQAIAYVGEHEEGAAGRAFRRASLRLRCGESVEVSLDKLVEELDAPGIGLLATALNISQRTGSPLRSLFQHSAMLVERQGDFERTLAVKTAQVRLSVRIVSLLPVVMVSLLSLLSPDYRAGLYTGGGMACVLVAAVMDAFALVIIRNLMKGVL